MRVSGKKSLYNIKSCQRFIFGTWNKTLKFHFAERKKNLIYTILNKTFFTKISFSGVLNGYPVLPNQWRKTGLLHMAKKINFLYYQLHFLLKRIFFITKGTFNIKYGVQISPPFDCIWSNKYLWYPILPHLPLLTYSLIAFSVN